MTKRDPIDGARIFLCVGGGIAAYKAAALTSTLVQRGATIDVAMTQSAERFVTPLTFASLTARQVYTSLWDAPERIPHVRLVREAQVALVVPATANLIAKLAHGIADDLVSSALLAARIPIVLAPAMNDAMYAHPATQENLRTLRERGCTIVDPERGFLAERESGMGRLTSEEAILAAIETVLARSKTFAGKRVLITAGATREAFDPVRFVSNASTGATGIALAREARARGAEVILLLGPTQLEPPADVETMRFQTAQELRDIALARARDADVIFAAAAVSDWRPQTTSSTKLKKNGAALNLKMARTPDVLEAIGKQKGKAFLVGFAAETEDHERNARQKLRAKHLDAIAVNDVSNGKAFGMQRNALTLLWGKDERREFGSASKDVLAARLLDSIAELMD